MERRPCPIRNWKCVTFHTISVAFYVISLSHLPSLLEALFQTSAGSSAALELQKFSRKHSFCGHYLTTGSKNSLATELFDLENSDTAPQVKLVMLRLEVEHFKVDEGLGEKITSLM